jgi:hypothetical protein
MIRSNQIGISDIVAHHWDKISFSFAQPVNCDQPIVMGSNLQNQQITLLRQGMIILPERVHLVWILILLHQCHGIFFWNSSPQNDGRCLPLDVRYNIFGCLNGNWKSARVSRRHVILFGNGVSFRGHRECLANSSNTTSRGHMPCVMPYFLISFDIHATNLGLFNFSLITQVRGVWSNASDITAECCGIMSLQSGRSHFVLSEIMNFG